MKDLNIKIAIVVSEFNSKITSELLDGAVKTLLKSGFAESQIKIMNVPGAVEIPFTAKLLANTKIYSVIIALGAIIRGDTDHYDYVCQQISYGCQKVMLDLNIPVIFGVLTTKNLKQAYNRISYQKEHKGVEAAQAAIKMLDVISSISM